MTRAAIARYQKKWARDNKEHRRKYLHKYNKTYRVIAQSRRLKLKTKVFEHYCGPAPVCQCGEKDMRVLTLHHVNGGGSQHRRKLFGNPNAGGNRFYRALIKLGYPKIKFAALCANCHLRMEYDLPPEEADAA